MRSDALLHGLTEVHPQVKAISHLLGGRPGSGAFSVGTGPIKTHDLDAGVGKQPGRQRRGVPGGQHVDDAVRFPVGQHSGVGVAAFDREVVQPQHARSAVRRVGHRPHPVQQPRPAPP